MPKEVYHAYAYVRKGRGGGSYPGGPVAGLEGRPDRAGVRGDHGRLDQESPLYVWQTGSGTLAQTLPFTDLAPTASAYIGRHSDQRPHASGCGTLLESAIERGEQVETSSLCDSSTMRRLAGYVIEARIVSPVDQLRVVAHHRGNNGSGCASAAARLSVGAARSVL